MRRKLILALVPLAVLLPQDSARAQDSSDDIGSVDRFRASYLESVRQFDATGQARHFTADAVMYRPGQPPLESREEIRTFWTNRWNGETGINPLVLYPRETIRAGDIVVERGAFGPEGTDPVGDFVWVLEREGVGEWKIRWISITAPRSEI